MAIKLLDKLNLPLKQRPRRPLTVLRVLVLAAGGLWFWSRDRRGNASFRTAQVTRGDLMASISATGTVEPEEVVDVGGKVAGRIMAFGKDKNGKQVDYGRSA